jgi:hypothetical protein
MFDVSTSASLAGNGSRAGDRNPVLRLRQGYGACTLLAVVHYFCVIIDFSQVLTIIIQENKHIPKII